MPALPHSAACKCAGLVVTRGDIEAGAKLVGWREQTKAEHNYHFNRRSRLKRFERWDSPVCWLPADEDGPQPRERREPKLVNHYPHGGPLPDEIEERLKNRVRIAQDASARNS